MPSVCGILMSVTMTSNKALSSFFFAASPELTVSTLWPSRRKAISSISQMERSSSQTSMLPMRAASLGGYGSRSDLGNLGGGSFSLRRFGAFVFRGGELAQTQYKFASLPQFR